MQWRALLNLLHLFLILFYTEAGAMIDAVILSHAGNKVFNMSLTSALRYLPDVATFHIISRGNESLSAQIKDSTVLMYVRE